MVIVKTEWKPEGLKRIVAKIRDEPCRELMNAELKKVCQRLAMKYVDIRKSRNIM